MTTPAVLPSQVSSPNTPNYNYIVSAYFDYDLPNGQKLLKIADNLTEPFRHGMEEIVRLAEYTADQVMRAGIHSAAVDQGVRLTENELGGGATRIVQLVGGQAGNALKILGQHMVNAYNDLVQVPHNLSLWDRITTLDGSPYPNLGGSYSQSIQLLDQVYTRDATAITDKLWNDTAPPLLLAMHPLGAEQWQAPRAAS